jgi:lysophospholipase L1-like esterase
VSLEAEAARGGVLVHNLGVGGSGFAALEQQQRFEPQFAALEPDIVLLDWGTNDIIDRERVGPGHADLVARTVRRIRAVRPQAVIVLTSVQDMLPRGRRAPPAAAYAGLMRELAARHGCLFYDWHDVAGGEGAMAHWRQAQLAQPDGVHLSAAGYQLKGRLLAEALLRAMGASREPPARPAGGVPARG